jgi:hypothetical protein
MDEYSRPRGKIVPVDVERRQSKSSLALENRTWIHPFRLHGCSKKARVNNPKVMKHKDVTNHKIDVTQDLCAGVNSVPR